MGLFGGCDYLETSGSFFTEYRCKYSRQTLDSRTAQDICMTSRYADCADYKNASGCFITTAVCLTLGKPDRCEELFVLRNFRDKWLREQSDGPALIEEYYKVAPGIVAEIDKRADSRGIYKGIYEEYIKPCVESVKTGDYEECRDIYIAMVNALKSSYGIEPTAVV